MENAKKTLNKNLSGPFKYYAFISYCHEDKKWAKRLQFKLEHYKIPSGLNGRTDLPKAIRPVFKDDSELTSGDIPKQILDALEQSRYLVVICSPRSAKSDWVNKETEAFINLGRKDNIIPFVIEGTAYSKNPDTECYPIAILDLPCEQKLGLPSEKKILGADINRKTNRWPWLNKEHAYAQLVSRILGVGFDDIWQRHKRRIVRNAFLWAIGVLLVIASMLGIWKYNQSFDAEVRLKEVSVHNDNLPPLRNAIVTMMLDNETKTDTVFSLDSSRVFSNIPHRYLNKEVHFKITCKYYLDVDTVLVLKKTMVLNIQRNPDIYGNVHFWLFNTNTEEPVANDTIYVDGKKTVSGKDGRVELFIPLEKQKRVYKVSASRSLFADTIIMPLAENAFVRIN